MFTTPNYMFCFNTLKEVFYMGVVDFDSLYGDENATKNFLLKSLILMKDILHSPVPPQYIDLKFHFEENEERKAIIVELPDAASECDCNYIALRKSKDGSLLFLSSELYVFGHTFMLCAYTQTAHYAMSKVIGSYDDFVAAALAVADGLK